MGIGPLIGETMKKLKNTSLLLSLLFFVSCSSKIKERTIASMDDNSRPAWATLEKSIVLKDGKLLIVGFQELDVDAKVSASYRLADNSVRNEFSKMIQNQFSSILQNLEEGVSADTRMTRYYSSEVSKNIIRDLKITSRYWEKIQTFDGDGETIYRLRVYSLGEIPESKLKKMIRESLEKEDVDPEIKKQIQGHFENEIKQFSQN